MLLDAAWLVAGLPLRQTTGYYLHVTSFCKPTQFQLEVITNRFISLFNFELPRQCRHAFVTDDTAMVKRVTDRVVNTIMPWGSGGLGGGGGGGGHWGET